MLGTAFDDLAGLQASLGQSSEADASAAKAIELFEKLAREHPEDAQFARVWRAATACEEDCSQDAGHHREAEASYREAIDILERLGDDHSEVTDKYSLAYAYRRLSILHWVTGHPREAEVLCNKAVDLLEKVCNDNKFWGYQADLAATYRLRTSVLGEIGRAR